MGKRIVIGLLWFAAFIVGSYILIGFVAGLITGMKAPSNPIGEATQLTQEKFRQFLLLIVLLSGIAAAVGSWLGILPGAQSQNDTTVRKK
jgi:hypothetical protein